MTSSLVWALFTRTLVLGTAFHVQFLCHNKNGLKNSLTFQKSDSQGRTDSTLVWGASWPHRSPSTCRLRKARPPSTRRGSQLGRSARSALSQAPARQHLTFNTQQSKTWDASFQKSLRRHSQQRRHCSGRDGPELGQRTTTRSNRYTTTKEWTERSVFPDVTVC